MQVAQTFHEPMHRCAVGLAALLFTSAIVTPMNVEVAPRYPTIGKEFSGNPKIAENVLDKTGANVCENLNLKSMEKVSGDNYLSCINLNTVNYMGQMDKVDIEWDLRSNVVSSILNWEGVAYRYGGQSKNGVDCSALVQNVYRENGINLPRTSYQQFREGVGIPRSNLKPGDLVFFNTGGAGASHVGVYLGKEKFISATKNCVMIQSLDMPYWNRTYRGSRRIIV
ncbi:MAG: NlpC/P60 family protein [Eubacteriales bacterium]